MKNEEDFVRRSDVIKAINEHSFFINNQCTYPSEGCIEVIEDAINVPPVDRSTPCCRKEK